MAHLLKCLFVLPCRVLRSGISNLFRLYQLVVLDCDGKFHDLGIVMNTRNYYSRVPSRQTSTDLLCQQGGSGKSLVSWTGDSFLAGQLTVVSQRRADLATGLARVLRLESMKRTFGCKLKLSKLAWSLYPTDQSALSTWLSFPT